ncbi:hypothetical protein [Krasilnikovia sp. M28-CT-15]|uniref:hypothetical protein n=1 Tax=Krasilnikovia sp. M28-CT-15 TaxID=3373540 RepID=UPI00399CD75E
MNRSAARKASAVAALRRARLAAHEQQVTDAVAVFFDRTGRVASVRAEAAERAQRIVADAEQAAAVLMAEAETAVAALKALGEPVVEIAAILDVPVSTVRAALARADQPTDRAPARTADVPAAAAGGRGPAVLAGDAVDGGSG